MASRTRDKKFHNNCDKCKYLHFEVQEGGGWLEICEVTGGRVIGSDEVKSDNCQFMEVEDYKMNKYEKMWEQMKNSLWKCYWEKNNKTFRCADVLYMMRMVEKEINTREEAKADSGRE